MIFTSKPKPRKHRRRRNLPSADVQRRPVPREHTQPLATVTPLGFTPAAPRETVSPSMIPGPRPYIPEPPRFDALTAPLAAVTAPAFLAREDARFATVCSVQCGRQGCTHSTSRGGTASFRDLYTAARLDGWRTDWFGTWTCPACQQKPGYWPALEVQVTVRDEAHEYALIERVTRAAGTPDEFVTALRSAA